MALILIVDDELDMRALLDVNLRQAGFETMLASSGQEALRKLSERLPDLVLLDLMLPDVPGTEVCRALRAEPRTRQLPVVMVTARTAEADRLSGLQLGADDYVPKPFSVRELILRVRAVLRRASAPAQALRPSAVGPIRLDHEAHRVYVEGREIELTVLEFKLLSALLARPGLVVTREQLLGDVWERSTDEATRTLDTHMKRLRQRLGPARHLVETVRGIGYRLVEPPPR